MKKATIFDIERCSYVDGPGIRTTVFFKGCNLRCAWCHNPESQSGCPQMLFYRDKCTGCGKCRNVCSSPEECTLCGRCTIFCPADARKVCGKEYTADEVFAELEKDKAYYENSGGGVTFSGGECLLQADFLTDLLKKCKENGIHTAVDTAGHLPYEIFEKILPYTDLFLYDLKIWDGEKHQKYVGAPNTKILENLKRLLKTAAVWVRIPLMAGVNDSEEELLAIRAFLEQYGPPEKVELLPYHAMGEHKYTALGQEPQSFAPPAPERLEQLRRLFQ